MKVVNNFTCYFQWKLNLIAQIKWEIQIEGASEQDAEENICNRRLEKIAS
jgi:hypothetical protein